MNGNVVPRKLQRTATPGQLDTLGRAVIFYKDSLMSKKGGWGGEGCVFFAARPGQHSHPFVLVQLDF